jgi:hypothetical protein
VKDAQLQIPLFYAAGNNGPQSIAFIRRGISAGSRTG